MLRHLLSSQPIEFSRARQRGIAMGVSNNVNPQGLSRGTIIACIVLSVVGFLVYTGHGAHMLGLLPYLLILACPLMHVFMHGGHGHSHSHGDHNKSGEHGNDCCSGHGGSAANEPVTLPQASDSKGDRS